MKHEIKPGDLVLLKRSNNAMRKFVGQIHTVDRLLTPLELSVSGVSGRVWCFSPQLIDPVDGIPVAWREPDLQKLDNPGDDEVDEISTRKFLSVN